MASIERTSIVKKQRAKWHDQCIRRNPFKEGEWDLLYESIFKTFKGKLRTRWQGPYEIETIYNNGTVQLNTIDDEGSLLMANGH